MPSDPFAPPLPLRWLYVDFNSYFASVEQQLNPDLRGRPVAVVPVETDSTCAIAASYEAKACGVKTGTMIYEARRTCPGLVCVLAKHDEYVKFHQRIKEEIERHIPITATCSIDEMACRLMDNENSHKRAREIALSIKAGLKRNVGEFVTCSIGIAPNRYLAKVATDLQKPDGLTFIDSADLPHKLLGLKLRDLPGIGHNMEHRILMAGIGSMESLLALDAARMRKIWGSVWGERMWFLLRGTDLPEPETHRSSIGHSHVLAPELRAPARAKYVARRLTMKAASRLRRMGYYAKTLSVAARFENGLRLEGTEHCWRAQDSLTFIHMLDRLWAQIAQAGAGQRIKKVSMALYGLAHADTLQPELVPALEKNEMLARMRAEKMSRALDKINHRFGRDSVTLGMMPAESQKFGGVKIAFTRIPDVEEFLE